MPTEISREARVGLGDWSVRSVIATTLAADPLHRTPKHSPAPSPRAHQSLPGVLCVRCWRRSMASLGMSSPLRSSSGSLRLPAQGSAHLRLLVSVWRGGYPTITASRIHGGSRLMSDRTHDQSTALAGIDDRRDACSDTQYETTPRADDFDNHPTFRAEHTESTTRSLANSPRRQASAASRHPLRPVNTMGTTRLRRKPFQDRRVHTCGRERRGGLL